MTVRHTVSSLAGVDRRDCKEGAGSRRHKQVAQPLSYADVQVHTNSCEVAWPSRFIIMPRSSLTATCQMQQTSFSVFIPTPTQPGLP